MECTRALAGEHGTAGASPRQGTGEGDSCAEDMGGARARAPAGEHDTAGVHDSRAGVDDNRSVGESKLCAGQGCDCTSEIYAGGASAGACEICPARGFFQRAKAQEKFDLVVQVLLGPPIWGGP